jgi:uncharacterized 2Fe-2S/4Fe-4S cluster protein (DUF4445 family)
MKHFNITFEPEGRQISIHEGATLLEAASQAGIILDTVCGAKGTCGKCLVIIEPSKQEVLACQYTIHNDLTVTIPTQSRFYEPKILEHGIDVQARFRSGFAAGKLQPGETFGLAADIGTTTVVAKLVDLADGYTLTTLSGLNPQIKYGDDVISRIHYAQTDEKLSRLHKEIINFINELIKKLCTSSKIEPNQIMEMVVVGNTTMNHLFLRFPVSQLGQAPYEAFSLNAQNHPAKELGVSINPAANVYAAPCIAGFLGSDTTAVALAVNIASAKEMTLAVDIGTNGEIVLGTSDALYAASCAAGPAFEGARITHGSRAVDGAIEAVIINNDDIDLDVIGGASPRTICGSALIDAVAVLLDLGIIDATGRFREPADLQKNLPPKILSRITEYKNQPAFCLAFENNSQTPNVLLTQNDIRQTQLAKAAIRTGIKLLQKKIGIADSDIRQVFLAGAFGNYIRRENAVRIGLLPDAPLERVHFVGNAACSGAEMMLLGKTWRTEAEQLAQKIKYVEIAHEKDFTDVYAESMLF